MQTSSGSVIHAHVSVNVPSAKLNFQDSGAGFKGNLYLSTIFLEITDIDAPLSSTISVIIPCTNPGTRIN